MGRTFYDLLVISRRTTPPRTTQLDDPPWEKFGRDCAAIKLSRSEVMRRLILWWIRWPGAKLPQRPQADREP